MNKIEFTPTERLQNFSDAVFSGRMTTDEMLDNILDDGRLVLALYQSTKRQLRQRLEIYLKARRARISRPAPAEAGQKSVADKARLRLPASATKPAQMSVAMKAGLETAREFLLEIDGRDIREWTIGECLSIGKHKAREGKILQALGGQLHHLNHTATIGSILNDEQIKEVIKEAA